MTSSTLTATDKEILSVLRRARKQWPVPRLEVIDLPAGRVPGFSIDFALATR